MFVGATGVGRVVERTVELMKEHDTDDVRPHGGIDVATLQRYLNFHCSVSLDLFGAETSTNAANYFAGGLKGRYKEESRDDDHQLHDATRMVPHATDDGIGEREAPALTALNETLREDYLADCRKGVERWNRTLADVGQVLTLPHVGFNRHVGTFSNRRVSPDGRLLTEAEWTASVDRWLPTDGDRAFVESLMVGVTEPGRMAGWVAPPSTGIHAKPVDFEYVKL
jgi:benzoyl-CoA 2,3-dioxygenase component B